MLNTTYTSYKLVMFVSGSIKSLSCMILRMVSSIILHLQYKPNEKTGINSKYFNISHFIIANVQFRECHALLYYINLKY